MPSESSSLFLDSDKHPYIVMGKKGGFVARFSNLPCAVRTLVGTRHRNGGKVVTPEGHVFDSVECHALVNKENWWKGLPKAQSTGVVEGIVAVPVPVDRAIEKIYGGAVA